MGVSDNEDKREESRDSARAAALTVGASQDDPGLRNSRTDRRGLSPKERVGMAALALASAVLIGVGAFALANVAQPGGASDASQTAAVSHDAQTSDAAQGGEETKASESAETQEGSSDEGSSESKGGDAQSETTGASGVSAGSASSSDAGNGTSAGASSSSGSGNASDAGGASSGEAPRDTVSVTVSVSSSAVGNPVSGSASPTFSAGATVYDALCACGLSVSASQTQYGIYVAAIGGLAEKEHGASSGWMYSVNGNVPMTSCSNYKLSDGDVVSWYYVTG